MLRPDFRAFRKRFKVWSLMVCCLGALACTPTPSNTASPVAPRAEHPSPPRDAVKKVVPKRADEPHSSPLAARATNLSWGNRTAPVVITEFTDLQCPFCQRGHEAIKALKKRYTPEQLRVVVRHFPLPFHDLARPAALITQAIGHVHGPEKAWLFIDHCFQMVEALDLRNALEKTGVTVNSIDAYMRSGEPTLQVRSDLRAAEAHGVEGTPHFFINGRSLSGAYPADDLAEIIDAELEATTKMLADGVPASELARRRFETNFQPPKPKKPPAPPERDKTVHFVPVGESPVRGPANALVTVVEFGDFECPYCARVQGTLQQLASAYPGKIRFVYKHRPLNFHPNAVPAANLSLFVRSKQGDAGFWRAKRLLLERHEALGPEPLRSYAEQLGVSPDAAMQAVSRGAFNAAIDADSGLADDAEANGTPHFFINGQRLVGAQPLDVFKSVVDDALRKAEALVAGGTAPSKVYETLMKSAKRPDPPPTVNLAPSTARLPTWGPRKAKITVDIFSDFECPYCARTVPTLQALAKRYKGDIRFVFHHYPLDFHPRAMPAHIAAHEVFVAKGSKAFQDYHDALFESELLDDDTLAQLAKKVGVNPARIKQAIKTQRHRALIEADMALASKSGIDGTPSFVINGRYLIGGAQPTRAFVRAIEAATNPR